MQPKDSVGQEPGRVSPGPLGAVWETKGTAVFRESPALGVRRKMPGDNKNLAGECVLAS